MDELDDHGIGDEAAESDDTGTAETTHGDGDTEAETGGSTTCTASVTSLTITDDTDPASVECVTKVLGDLIIGPSIGLVDLQLLGELREVGGTLYIVGNLGLTSLEGLEQLDEVGWLHVRRNGALVDLHGPDSLATVERISVINNDKLTSLVGLPEGLSPAKLDIAGNDILADLDDLPALNAPSSGLPVDIHVEDHQSLTNVGGLAGCCSTQPVVIELARNTALADLDGLEPFQRFTTLRLIDNRKLHDLAGIDATEIGTFEVSYNHCSGEPDPVLDDFAGLEQIVSIETLIVEWVASLDSFVGLENMHNVTDMHVHNNVGLDWELVVDLASQSGPTLFDACGVNDGLGLDGPDCAIETCPTF